MGDRANIFFVDTEPSDKGFVGLYFYTHWAGDDLPKIVQKGLKRGKGRWGDSPYLSRILFCELVQEDILGETGYGLSTFIGDNDHAVIRVDDKKMRVSFHEPGQETDPKDPGIASWSYKEFVALSVKTLNKRFT